MKILCILLKRRKFGANFVQNAYDFLFFFPAASRTQHLPDFSPERKWVKDIYKKYKHRYNNQK